MKKLQSIKALDNYLLVCFFDNGDRKIADITPYLQSEAFKPLLDLPVFKQVKNNGYYISWLNEEIDLSADTLWHIGKTSDSEIILNTEN